MNTLMRKSALALVGLMSGALVAYAVPAANAAKDAVYTRAEDSADVVMTMDDDDDDDSNDNTDNSRSFNSGTGNSNDNTNSRETRVSRDRDLSRDDLTKDRTNDGPGKNNRDWSQNRTNDRSRNDTR
jgi:hypothetical protein